MALVLCLSRATIEPINRSADFNYIAYCCRIYGLKRCHQALNSGTAIIQKIIRKFKMHPLTVNRPNKGKRYTFVDCETIVFYRAPLPGKAKGHILVFYYQVGHCGYSPERGGNDNGTGCGDGVQVFHI